MTDDKDARIAALEAQLAEVADERDKALEELGKVIMACPAGQRSMPISATVASMRTRIATLEIQLAEALKALAPFAKLADVYDKHPTESFRRNHTDDTPIHSWFPAYCDGVTITVGDARHAAKVLNTDDRR